MGFNSTVVVMNDALHVIAEDKDFGKNLAEAITNASWDRSVHVAAVAGRNIQCNAATVVETHHADQNMIVRVGQNCGIVLNHWGRLGEGSKTEVDIDRAKQAIKEIAYANGFDVTFRMPKEKVVVGS